MEIALAVLLVFDVFTRSHPVRGKRIRTRRKSTFFFIHHKIKNKNNGLIVNFIVPEVKRYPTKVPKYNSGF
jgi:hypothetical protein